MKIAKLSKIGNLLEKIGYMIDFESFRSAFELNMLNNNKKSNAGCRPYDVVLMLIIILLKRFYNLNDEKAEYQITDCLNFKDFSGLSTGDRIPVARSIYEYLQRVLIGLRLNLKLYARKNIFRNPLIH